MKKSIIGLVFGLIVGLTLSASASSVLGKTIDAIYPLYVSGTRSPVDAISIEGTSYIPVRVAAETFGYDVSFSSDVILLTKQETEPATPTPGSSIIVPETETITMAEYNQLEIGMSYDEAVEIIGGDGIVSSERINRIIYTWYGSVKGSSCADITFKDNKLISKLQRGLE
jgi:hypothetical protein